MALQITLCAVGFARIAAAFPTSRLVYARGPGTESCPEREVLRQAVTTRLGYDPFFPSSDKTIIARISREAGRLRGQVELLDERGLQLGLREFSSEAERCDELVRAMALTISIAIDPHSAETYSQGPADEPPELEPAPVEPSATEPRKAVAELTPERPPARSARSPGASGNRSSLEWTAGVGVRAAFDVAPQTTLGALGFLSVRDRRWAGSLEGRANLPVTGGAIAERFRVFTAELAAVPCLRLGVAFVCETTSLVWLNASGSGVSAHGGTSLSLNLGARLGAELRLNRRFSLLAQADLSANPWPVRLVANGQTVWQTPTLTEGLGLAAAVHFW